MGLQPACEPLAEGGVAPAREALGDQRFDVCGERGRTGAGARQPLFELHRRRRRTRLQLLQRPREALQLLHGGRRAGCERGVRIGELLRARDVGADSRREVARSGRECAGAARELLGAVGELPGAVGELRHAVVELRGSR